MGFFADIIRDSRREGVAVRTPEAPVPCGGEEVPSDAPVAAEGAPVAPAAVSGSDVSVIGLREEGGGTPVTAGEILPRGDVVTRKVVDPSLSEHTPVAGIPEVMAKGVTLPNPVKREQAGSESDRTETGEFRVEQMESFHDGGSIDVPLVVSVSASDSSVRESSSGYAASRTGKVSVETQGRRQAGETREGSTTPPDDLSGETSEAPFPQGTDEPTPSELQRTVGEALEVPSIPRKQPLLAQRPEQTSQAQSDGMPECTPRSTVVPVRESFEDEKRHEPLPDVIPAAVAVSSVPVPTKGENSCRATDRQLPPLPRDGDEGKRPVSTFSPPEPQVTIGTIEVVVVAPAPVERPPRSEERFRPDLASRHYLRNF